MRLLIVNTGSSSLKLSLLDERDRLVAEHTVQRWQGEDDLSPLERFLQTAGPVDAVGHRVVHGGPRHLGPAPIDVALLDELAALTDLAPLHQPRALAGIRAVSRLLPEVPAVASFDTAFHARMPPAAATYALPAAWNARWGLRRYGFHGLSHRYASRRAAEITGARVEALRMVSCHLGAGASLCAVRDGRSVDTTMGFTPLAGLVMVTRCGSVDPGLVLWLLEHTGLSVAELREVLEHHSGLAGLSGTSGDLRDVLAARAAGDGGASLAFEVFIHRLAREAAAMTVAAGGLDVLVITGGMGEHSALVRCELADRLAHLGVALDEGRNDGVSGDGDVSADGAAVRTVVVIAREDLEVAAELRAVLSSAVC
ncbi:acetate/propionate family kinase [Pseudonocardia bannensis]|uniref:Acetate kinase n=1 Tax=Pseudonocardia bannensis TaxID=630973 RepID=A0A848DES9_9PSEU|nr:acetate/propionate family kinase [Pseudonocardia bannensis]NMH91084.1 acetate/propionate family kinase [Pseudonocardia bannensis]